MCLYETAFRRFTTGWPGVPSGIHWWSRGSLIPIVARGDQLSSSSSFSFFDLGAEAFVVSTTLGLTRAEADFHPVYPPGTTLYPLHSACAECAGHFLWPWAGAALLERDASGCWAALFIFLLYMYAAPTRTQLRPSGRLPSPVPAKGAAHISPQACGRCSLSSQGGARSCAWILGAFLASGHLPGSCRIHLPPMRRRVRESLIRRSCACEKILSRFSVQYEIL